APERLIAIGRALFALSSLIAIWPGPTGPAHAVVSAYAVYAGLLMVLSSTSSRPAAAPALATHAVDVVICAVLMYRTGEPGNPFFLCMAFALMSAALRWQARGTLWTAAALLAGGVALASAGSLTLPLNRFLTRVLYVAVLAVV
ncbi:MAG: hypothetical protein DMD81_08475, partial [Candidatus Rokuibacteriota bacterium]